jgi:hypothetical protein
MPSTPAPPPLQHLSPTPSNFKVLQQLLMYLSHIPHSPPQSCRYHQCCSELLLALVTPLQSVFAFFSTNTAVGAVIHVAVAPLPQWHDSLNDTTPSMARLPQWCVSLRLMEVGAMNNVAVASLPQ